MDTPMIIPTPEEDVLSHVDLVAEFSQIQGVHGPDCHSWTSALLSRMRAAEEDKDEQARRLWHLLFIVCDPYLWPEQGGPPYGPWRKAETSRTFVPGDLEQGHLDFLSKTLADAMPSDFRARVLDFRWLRLKDHEAARKAVPLLLQTAETMFALKDTKAVRGANRLTRAGQIALELGGDPQALGEVAHFLKTKFHDRGLSHIMQPSQGRE